MCHGFGHAYLGKNTLVQNMSQFSQLPKKHHKLQSRTKVSFNQDSEFIANFEVI
jgi:hypothetical protein